MRRLWLKTTTRNDLSLSEAKI